MNEPHGEVSGTVGELLDLIEGQAANTAAVVRFLIDRDHVGSLVPVAGALLDNARHNLGRMRLALAEHDALDYPLSDGLRDRAWSGKLVDDVPTDTADRITSIIEAPTDTEPESEAENKHYEQSGDNHE